MKAAIITEEQIKAIIETLENHVGVMKDSIEEYDKTLAIVKSLKGQEPAVLLHVRATDTYPHIDFQVMDGEKLQPSMTPIPVYAGEQP